MTATTYNKLRCLVVFDLILTHAHVSANNDDGDDDDNERLVLINSNNSICVCLESFH